MNRADARVIQRRCGLGLTSKPLQGLAILGHAFRQELKGDKAVQPRVFGLVDNTHAAATELLDDAVVRDGLAKHKRTFFSIFLSLLLSVSYSCLAQVSVPFILA